MLVNHNLPALITYNAANLSQSLLKKTIQRLSSGLRINSAADDAAGLAISEKMRAQTRGLDQATRNAQNGVSMIQTAEGALQEVHSILQRMRELSVQAANDTLTSQDREYVQLEVDQLKEEIDRIANTTQFNRKKLLDGSSDALWSSDRLTTEALIHGRLTTTDQFGQTVSAEGNYKIEIEATPGQAQVQKSNVYEVAYAADPSLPPVETLPPEPSYAPPVGAPTTPEPTAPMAADAPPAVYEMIDINALTAPTSGNGWTFDFVPLRPGGVVTDAHGLLTLTAGGDFRIVGDGTVTNTNVKVSGAAKTDVILENVKIESAIGYSTSKGRSPLDLEGADVNLYLEGDNRLVAGLPNPDNNDPGQHDAGIYVPPGSKLVITDLAGDGQSAATLTAEGGANHGAGIGGGCSTQGGHKVGAGDITINGGHIIARGGNDSAGIGGGGAGGLASADAVIEKITINGGTVEAYGGDDGAGIGGGYGGGCGDITINGGEVTAVGGDNGAGIGGANEGTGGNIMIVGGTVEATGGSYGAGIGGGASGRGDKITIDNANGTRINAAGRFGGAGIGGGYGSGGGEIFIYDCAEIVAESDSGAGIGGGSGGGGGKITIVDGGSIAARSDTGAGIGGGNLGDGGEISIFGGMIAASSASGGAGIGGGTGNGGGKITIVDLNGTTITATGGDQNEANFAENDFYDPTAGDNVHIEFGVERTYSGAGIGGGAGGGGGEIAIYGGAVAATGGVNAAGIGGGFMHSLIYSIIDYESSDENDRRTEDRDHRGGDGGVIDIMGGDIAAESGAGSTGHGAAIGGGLEGDGGAIRIFSDITVAGGAEGGAAIGGGENGGGGTISIIAGEVNVTGGAGAAAVGGGQGGVGGETTVFGGALKAVGGDGGAGIGGGEDADGGAVMLVGGKLSVRGGAGGAGVGGGRNGAGGDITVYGGNGSLNGGVGATGIGGGQNGAAAKIKAPHGIHEIGETSVAPDTITTEGGVFYALGGVGAIANVDALELAAELSEGIQYTMLRDIAQFYDGSGKFSVDLPQTLTIYQGDGKSTSVTLYGDDTMYDVAQKINEAIAEGLRQGSHVEIDDQFATISDGTAETSESIYTSEEIYGPPAPLVDVFGRPVLDENGSPVLSDEPSLLETKYYATMLVRSAVPGAEGELTFTGDEDILKALGLSTIQESRESAFTVTVTDAHTGALVTPARTITGNTIHGAVTDNVDVTFDPLADIDVNWNEEEKRFDFTSAQSIYTTYVHLVDNTTTLQTGANEGEDLALRFGSFGTSALGLRGVLVVSREAAARAVTVIDGAISRVSKQRATLGAYQNRLGHTIDNLASASSNLTAAESRIRDADMAKEMLNFTKLNILLQTGTSMMTQANQMPQAVLSLLR